MPARSYWKGYLKLALVTCPIQMIPATGESEKLRFRTINRATGHPVVSRSVDSVTGAVVESEDQVKGYPKGEQDYVMLEDADLDAVALESTRTIDIDRFVPQGSIGWVWLDTPHYLLPSDPVGQEAFAVIRAAMAATGRAGMSRLVMGGRERAVMLTPCLDGILLWTLRFGDEVRDGAELQGKGGEAAPDKALLAMVCKLIDARTGPWDPALLADPVQDKLRAIIAAKRAKKPKPPKRKAAAPAAAQDNVVSIMDALKRSLAKGAKR